jgi:hypothetical protein
MSSTYNDLTADIQVINTTYAAAGATGLHNPDLVTGVSCGTSAKGDSFTNTGREFVYITNGTGTDLQVTINDQSVCTHGFDHDVVSIIPTGGHSVMLGPFPVKWFTTTCLIDYDVTKSGTSPKIFIFQLPTVSPGPGQG